MKPGKSASSITYPALLGAVSIILLYGSAISPTGAIGLVALAGVPCAGVVIAGGTSAGLLCWGAVSVLGLLLVPDKFCVLLYAALFGLYPVVKSKVEALRRRPLEILCKLLFFNEIKSLPKQPSVNKKTGAFCFQILFMPKTVKKIESSRPFLPRQT